MKNLPAAVRCLKSLAIHSVLAFLILAPAISSADALTLLRPLELKSTYEQWNLPQGENMGMASIGLHQPLNDIFSVGVEARAALTGERGGFITLGVSGDLVYPLTRDWALESGLSVGAGGGRGGSYLTGGGLMLHARAGVRYALPVGGSVSVGMSTVDFPNDGAIRSSQPYIGYNFPFYALLEPGGAVGRQQAVGGLQLGEYTQHRHQIMLVTRAMNVPTSVRDLNGNADNDFGLVGVEWRTSLDDEWFVKLETEGAASGGSAGYMQILGGLGRAFPVTSRSDLIAAVAIGGGGGGGVDTGGGLLLDGMLGWQVYLSKPWSVELSWSRMAALSSDFRVSSLNARLAYQFGSSRRSGEPRAEPWLETHSMRVRVGTQKYLKASDNWRTQPDRDVDNLSIQLDYFLSPHWYLSGQGIAASGGGAGAYMSGLVGGGTHVNLSEKIYAEAELLSGAAGGGGINAGSGFVTQANLNLGFILSPALALVGTVGRMEALNGDFKANVLGVSLAYGGNVYSVRSDR
jgi:hypothetical protein